MLLMVSKHAEIGTYMPFLMKRPFLERVIMKFVERFTDVFYSIAVERFKRPYTMSKLLEDTSVFRYHRCTLYTTDVAFLLGNRSSGNKQEAKPYFSNKHEMYGFKTEVNVLPNRRSVGVGKHYLVSASDLTILGENLT